MPDLDSPPITGILEQSSATGGVVVGLHLSKRPRDEGSPPRGKRGRGENIEKSLTLQVPMLAPPPLTPCGNGSPQAPAPLCESPIANQASPTSGTTTPPPRLATVVLGDDGTGKHAENSTVEPASPAAMPSTIPLGAGVAIAKRKPRVLATATSGVGATDPIFHAAMLRVLHRRGGITCPEAKGWRWSGDAAARFDHWPSALHPAIMDLLASVSTGEERVALAGCDARHSECQADDGSAKQLSLPQLPPPPLPTSRRAASWRAPVPRTPIRRVSTAGVSLPLPATPVSHSRAAGSGSMPTPLSALRRPGSARRSGDNRVRFSTHDLSVVDTPDPARDGSEKGMVNAMDGLESILAAAVKVQGAVARGRSDGVMSTEEWGGDRRYEGYFDRFGATTSRDAEDPAADGTLFSSDGSALILPGYSKDIGQQRTDENSAGGRSFGQAEPLGDESQPGDESSALKDAVALVTVLHEMASSDSAPEELALSGGWGPEHSNAAAFYATELASLCGVDPIARAAEPAAVGSHLRARYLDVLSCLIRYNLKLLLNLCVCEVQETLEDDILETADIEDVCEQESVMSEMGDASDADEGLLSSPPSALTVVIPERATAAASWESTVTTQAERGCGCVTVLDGTGALEFNTEDVAALLTLALRRVRPFVPLETKVAAAVTAAAEDRGGDGEENDDGCQYDDRDDVDARVWSAVQKHAFESRVVTPQSGLFADAANNIVASGHARGSGADGECGMSRGGAGTSEDAAAVPMSGLNHACPGSDAESEDQSCLTVDEAADLLEYVAATRFVSQLIAEPVVAEGIAAGRWAATERLAIQIQKLVAKVEEEAAAAARLEGVGHIAVPSLSNTLGLGELADVRGLGERMVQQARHAPALEARLKGELRQALRRGQGSRQRRLKSRLHQMTVPDVFSFPMVAPCCNLAPSGDDMMT